MRLTRTQKAKIALATTLLFSIALLFTLLISFTYIAMTAWSAPLGLAASMFFSTGVAGVMLGAIFGAVFAKPLDFKHLEEQEDENNKQVP